MCIVFISLSIEFSFILRYWQLSFNLSCFKVWNQKRPPWFEAIVTLVAPLLPFTTDIVINAVQTEASMYQAMALILACFSQFWDCIRCTLPQICNLLQELIPAHIIPLNHSCLLQILVSALYSYLLKKSEKEQKEVRFAVSPKKEHAEKAVTSFDATNSTPASISQAVAEALCSIDEDNKHTDQIEDLLEQVSNWKKGCEAESPGSERVETGQEVTEILVSDLLMTSDGSSSLKVRP